MTVSTLLVTPDFPPELGGIATYLWNVYSRGPMDDMIVVAPERQGCDDFDSQSTYQACRIRTVQNVPGLRGLSFMCAAHTMLERLIAAHPHAIIHCGHILSAIVASRLKRKYGTRYLVWTHALEVMDRKLAIPTRNALCQADLVITNSEYTRHFIQTLGTNRERIMKIHPAADPERFSPFVSGLTLARRFGIDGRQIILTLGRLSRTQRYKGQDMVIRSLPTVISAIPDAVYVVAGSGEDTEYLANLAAQVGVSDHLKLVGKIPEEDLPALYACCKVFVLCSREVITWRRTLSEGFGIVLIEASASGKPVIGGMAGGIPDAVRDGETGLLVNPTDPSAIAQALIRILVDPRFGSALGSNGRAWAVKELNWNRARAEFDQAVSRLSAKTTQLVSPRAL